MDKRSITPLPPADFTPTLGDYKELRPFRFWCQKILPLVYDDSLSYYELLCKVVDYLNKTMEDVDTLHDDVTNLLNAYTQLQNYVNLYFTSLDVQEEINNKLDQMAKSGELLEIIRPTIVTQTTSWLQQHITNPANPPIDTSLKVGNAAADSKTVGDLSFLYREHISNISFNECTEYGMYILGQNDFNTMTDGPNVVFEGGVLLVYASLSSLTSKTQLLLESTTGKMYIRYSNNSGEWREWNLVGNDTFRYRSHISSGSFNDYTEYGMYILSSSDFNGISNGPDVAFGGGVLLVYGSLSSLTSRTQVLLDSTTGNQWVRFSNNSGVWRAWNAAGTNVENKTWYALGDSITLGVYSSDPDTTGVTAQNYVTLYAKANNLNVVNYGERGMGYVAIGTSGVDLSSKIAGMSEDAPDVVSVALGVNDYNTSGISIGSADDAVGADTIIGKVKYCIETLLTKYPTAALYIFSPFMSNRNGGDASTLFDVNKPHGGKTLGEVSEAIKSVCEIYNTTFVDVLLSSPYSTPNISSIIPDGVHPSVSGHKAIASNLARMFVR